MKRVGVFLSVKRSAGGMFHYSEAIVEALLSRKTNQVQVVAIAPSRDWLEMIEGNESIEINEAGDNFLGRVLTVLQIVGGESFGKLARKLGAFNPLLRSLRRSRLDAVIFPCQDLIGGCFEGPSIICVHDLMHIYEPGFPEVSLFGRYIFRERRFTALSRSGGTILADSNIGMKQFQVAFNASTDRTKVLRYCIPPYSDIDLSESEDLSRRYRLPSRFIFYPAQYWEHKNHRRLLMSMKRLMARYEDLHLVVTGSVGNMQVAIQDFAEFLGISSAVTFCPGIPQSHMPFFFKRSVLVVMPTFFGPTNIPPLEAMAFGSALAVSDIYGMREQCADGAIYFNPTSLNEICDAIEMVWSDETFRARLEEAALWQAESWNEDKFQSQFNNYLDDTLSP